MPGLISQSVPGATVAGAATTKFDPKLREVDTTTDTVQGQLNGLLSKGSPYIDVARAGAAQTANARGLLNSSIAASAGEEAAIKAALPIAAADASTYTHVADTNQNFENQAGQFNAAAENTSSLNMAQAANQNIAIGTQGAETRKTQAEGIQGQKDLTLLSGEVNKQLQTLKGEQATALTNIEANYKQLIQTSTAATQFYSTGITMLAAIMANTDTTAEQKQAAVSRVSGMLKGGLNVISAIGNVDLTPLLNFDPV